MLGLQDKVLFLTVTKNFNMIVHSPHNCFLHTSLFQTNCTIFSFYCYMFQLQERSHLQGPAVFEDVCGGLPSTRSNAVGRGPALQARRSGVQIPMVYFMFC